MKTTYLTPVRLVLPVVLMVAAAPVTAQQPQAHPEQKEHIVRRGDTLWDLARAYLQNPFLWRVIYEANRNVVEDPHWIYPAERLIIPPVLPRNGAPADAAPTDPPGFTRTTAVVEALPEGDPVPADTPATVLTTLELRRPAVSLNEYLSAPWLSPQPTAVATGRITAKTDPAARGERMIPTLYPQELVNVQVTGGRGPVVGDSLLMVRPGRRVEPAGNVVQPTGILRVERVESGVVVARVVAQFSDAWVGDLVAPLPAAPRLPIGTPQPVQSQGAGQLLQFVQQGGLHGPTDLAFVSAGRNQGLGIGDELAVYVPAGTGTAAVNVAVVRVVRVEDATATVRVVSVNSTALREGLPVSLIRRMP